LASRRRRRKSIGKVIVDVERRVRRVEKRPGAKRLKTNVVTTEKLGYRAVTTKVIKIDAVNTENIAPDAVTPIEASFGVNIVSVAEPEPEYLKPGTQWTNPETSETQVYDAGNEEFVLVGGADLIARQTADGKNTIYAQNDAPVASATVILKINDLWYDTNDGNKLYVWNGTAWSNIQDTAIAAAAQAATAAQNTADGKNKVYRQTAEPTGGTYAEGDLWFDTDDNNKIYRRTSGAWTGLQLGGNGLANINANAITAGTIDASVITVSNINAGNISTGTINADRIQANSLSVDKLTAGTLRTGTIYTGDIAAGQITAGTITAAISISSPTISGGTVSGATISLTGSQGVISNPSGGSWTQTSDTSNKLNFTAANYSVIPAGETTTYEVSGGYYDPVNEVWVESFTNETRTTNTVKITDTTLQGRIPSSEFYYGELYVESGSGSGGTTIWANYNGGYISFEVVASSTEKSFYIRGDGTNWTNTHDTTGGADQPAYLQADSAGKITRGRAIFTSGSSSATILGSSWSGVGQNGDLAFSTGN
jgi:hypothetical protein